MKIRVLTNELADRNLTQGKEYDVLDILDHHGEGKKLYAITSDLNETLSEEEINDRTEDFSDEFDFVATLAFDDEHMNYRFPKGTTSYVIEGEDFEVIED